MPKIAVIVPAGGVGRRMGADRPKQFLELAGLPVLVRTLKALRRIPEVGIIIVAAPAEHLEETRKLLAVYFPDDNVMLVTGGLSRQESVWAALSVLPSEINLVAVHDAVRPFPAPGLFRACLDATVENGAAMLAVPVKDTVKAVSGDNLVQGTVDRRQLWLAQTPQMARRDLLDEAFAKARLDNFVGTDEASLLERIGCQVKIVPGAERNLKITRPEDLELAGMLIGAEQGGGVLSARIGHGYDAHRLGENRRLVIGGVEIPFEKGLVGHSDADVLLHALADAMLGAAGLGDIGHHFPDSDQSYKDVSSLLLLERVVELLDSQGLLLVNADITVIAQQPKLSPYFSLMQEGIGRVCRVAPKQINLKATTTENMGFAGRGEGIAAHAVVLLGQS